MGSQAPVYYVDLEVRKGGWKRLLQRLGQYLRSGRAVGSIKRLLIRLLKLDTRQGC